MTSTNRLERALILFEQYGSRGRRARRRILRKHPELAEILGPMFEGSCETGPDPRVDGYRLEQCLGKGGMGCVYLAHPERSPNRSLALKVIDRDVVSPRVVQRFERERELLARLHHPNITAIFDAGITAEGHPFFVQEYVEGGSPITVYCDEHGIGRRGRIRLLRLVARALGHAHRRGILHRDIKPSNLLVGRKDGDHRPVVIDFGVARSLTEEDGEERLTDLGQVVGTKGYLSPEQAAGVRNLDVRTDVYSLGRVLGELVSPKSSIRLRAIHLRATAREPSRRYANIHQFAEDLECFLRGEPLRHARYGIERLFSWLRRQAAVWFCILSSLSFLSFGIHRALRWRDEQRAEERRAIEHARTSSAVSTILADLEAVHELRDLARRAEGMWPLVPSRRPELERWIEEARRFDPVFERLREETSVRSTAPPPLIEFLEEEFGKLLPTSDAARRTPFGNDLPSVRERLVLVSAIQEGMRSARVLEARRACLERMARSNGPYSGASAAWVLPEDLVPLGCDPRSKLEEFAVFGTGEIPERRPDGSLVVTAETGIVLVFLPGGTFVRGAQGERPEDPNYDPHGSLDVPPTPSTVPSFWIAKYELTQAQWERMTGTRPSTYGRRDLTLNVEEPDRHPVETIAWKEAEHVLHRYGLELPERTAWEYACRARTNTPWSTGARVETLQGAANLADLSMVRAAGLSWNESIHDWDDGHPVHAPVGSFAPNAFGLHDMHGNVFEWLANGIATFEETKPGEGLAFARRTDVRHRLVIGGSWRQDASTARAAYVASLEPDQSGSHVGLRVVRPLP